VNYTILNHLLYLVIAIPAIVWVGNRLHTHGRQFVIDAFRGDIERGTAVNHLLLIGFYLVNLGLMALFIRFGDRPETAIDMIETVVGKIGVVLLALGGLHYMNLFNFDKMRRKGQKNIAQAKDL
jgi:hypothetical protein